MYNTNVKTLHNFFFKNIFSILKRFIISQLQTIVIKFLIMNKVHNFMQVTNCQLKSNLLKPYYGL